MKKINDGFIYLYILIITFAVGLILGLLFSYSRFFVEPDIKKYLSVTDEKEINENYKKAYLKLKHPQVFARYDFFDSKAKRIKNILSYYSGKIDKNEEFKQEDKEYLEILLERRILGSMLTRNTMIFFFSLSVLAIILYAIEARNNKKAA